jgi:hypothetical protein
LRPTIDLSRRAALTLPSIADRFSRTSCLILVSVSFSELLSWGQRRQRGRYCPLRQRGSFRIPRQLRERLAGSRLARLFLAGDAEKKAEEYMANGSYTGPLAIIGVLKL